MKGLFDPNNPSTPKDYGSAPDILMIGGTAIAVAAMSIAFASKENKKKARLYLNEENVMVTPEILTGARLTSIGIKISL